MNSVIYTGQLLNVYVNRCIYLDINIWPISYISHMYLRMHVDTMWAIDMMIWNTPYWEYITYFVDSFKWIIISGTIHQQYAGLSEVLPSELLG